MRSRIDAAAHLLYGHDSPSWIMISPQVNCNSQVDPRPSTPQCRERSSAVAAPATGVSPSYWVYWGRSLLLGQGSPPSRWGRRRGVLRERAGCRSPYVHANHAGEAGRGVLKEADATAPGATRRWPDELDPEVVLMDVQTSTRPDRSSSSKMSTSQFAVGAAGARTASPYEQKQGQLGRDSSDASEAPRRGWNALDARSTGGRKADPSRVGARVAMEVRLTFDLRP